MDSIRHFLGSAFPNGTFQRGKDLQEVADSVLPMLWLDVEGTIRHANDAFLRLFGYAADDLVGHPHTVLAEDAEGEQAVWDELHRGSISATLLRCRRQDGQPVWIDAKLVPFTDGRGDLNRVVLCAQDASDRQRQAADAEERLSETRNQLEAICGSMAVIEFDPQGKILTANEKFLQLMGYALEEIRGEHHGMFVDAAERTTEEYRAFWNDLGRGTCRTGEVRRLSKSAKSVWLQTSYVPVRGRDGEILKVVKLASDVSDRVAAVNGVAGALKALSGGDLDIRLSETDCGEFSGLREAFNTTASHLSDLVSSIRMSADQIAEETDVIATSVQNLSTRNEQQAARVEETSAAMTQMEGAVRSNAENTKASTELAGNAVSVAENGNDIVGQAIASMKEIEESADNIRRVNDVIDSIAFQTNLLALNAGVEAARAGEAGRGFAVVASEVRALAQRASEAARDINDLIQKSHDAVERGAALVTRSGQALSDIVTSVTSFAGNMREISSATSEQAQGISSVQEAIADIDITTQKTAAIAEESAAAATQLASRATDLREMVSAFNAKGRLQSADHDVVQRPVEENVAYLRPATPKVASAGGWTDF